MHADNKIMQSGAALDGLCCAPSPNPRQQKKMQTNNWTSFNLSESICICNICHFSKLQSFCGTCPHTRAVPCSRDYSPRCYAALKTAPASAPGHKTQPYTLCL